MRLFILIAFAVAGCASQTQMKTGILAPTCAKTSITENDMDVFGFKPEPGKVVVARVFATWCPYCKNDLERIGALYKSAKWNPQTVRLFLLAYHNHSEDRKTFDQFVATRLGQFGIPSEAVQIQYVEKTYADLERTQSASGQKLFEGWQGVPFALVFGKDGRLAFRGHFTMTDRSENAHYQFVSDLAKENCGG